MNRVSFVLSFALLIVCFLAVPEAAAQNVVIKVGDKVIVIPPQKVEKFKGFYGVKLPVKPRRPRRKRKPFVRTSGTGGLVVTDGYRGERGQGKRQKGLISRGEEPTLQEVEKLAREFKLMESPKENPQLAFTHEALHYWRESGLSAPELATEFAAIRTVLDAADSQKVSIRDYETLFEAADRFIVIVAPESSNKEAAQTKREKPPDVGSLLCEGDTSEALIRKAWEALSAGKGGVGAENLEKALACTKVAIDTFSAQADEQQAQRLKAGECKVPPGVNDRETYFRLYAALGDVGAAWFIRGQVFSQQHKWKEAREAYKVVTDKYSCAYAWDPRGWFWRLAEGAEREAGKLP